MPAIDRRTNRGKELAARLNRETILEHMPKVYFVKDRSVYRVGRTDWPGDQFEILEQLEFERFRHIYETRLGMVLLDKTHDD